MKRLCLILRILPLLGLSIFVAVAAMRVQADQAASVNKPKTAVSHWCVSA